MKIKKYLFAIAVIFIGCSQLETTLKLKKEKPTPINLNKNTKPKNNFDKTLNQSQELQNFTSPTASLNYTKQENKIINLETLSKDSLYTVISKKDALIDSLFTKLDSLYNEYDILHEKVEDLSSQVLVNKDFVIPSKIKFAGVNFDLTNERIYNKFEKIFKRELKMAHKCIPRSGKYFAYFDSVFTQYNIPLDVKYLAVAESHLSSMAGSSVGAVGVWQFMKGTAKMFGLTVNEFIDERRDVFKATVAAAKYLQNSHNYLSKKGGKDWLLTFCAYNAGSGSIARVMKQQGGKTFFDLILRVNETNEYVWRAVAIKVIFENEELIFGKKFERQENILKSTKNVKIKLNGHYRIDAWAKAQGTVLSKVWELNPWINIYKQHRRRYSAINNVVLPKGEFNILLPVNSVSDSNLVAAIEKKFLTKNNGFFKYHIVRKGDNLYDIARKYKTSVSKIKALNHMRNTMIKPGQRLKLQGSQNFYFSTAKSTYHTVKKGQTLGSIAYKYSISTKQLKQWNKLKNSIIYVGQKLRVKPKTNIYTGKTTSYIVKSGDYLGKIAKKFDMTIASLKNLNKLSSNYIKVGQKLKVANTSTKPVKNKVKAKRVSKNISKKNSLTYIVKKGDVLSKIAARYNISSKQILKINKLENTNICVGQKLKIPVKYSSYTVKKGDTLIGIAKKLKSNVNNLITINSIKKSSNKKYYILKPGQTLLY